MQGVAQKRISTDSVVSSSDIHAIIVLSEILEVEDAVNSAKVSPFSAL